MACPGDVIKDLFRPCTGRPKNGPTPVAMGERGTPPTLGGCSPLNDLVVSVSRSGEALSSHPPFARKQTIQPKVVDLNVAVTGMLKMLRYLIGEHIEVTCRPQADLWWSRWTHPSSIRCWPTCA